ncbi:MAG TPA: discoidin domain-containing protein, partial [Candidatus Binatia bacterium]|nr:discoidin domain-containing protein [Candidatus Binatia bacterium]
KPPHEFLISFPKPVAINGLVLMPRQNQRDHEGDIREYKLESSDNGTNWQTVANGRLASTFNPQTITFNQPLTTKHLKFTALSGFGSDESASLAEFAVMYAGPELNEGESNLKYRHVRTASPDIDAGGD